MGFAVKVFIFCKMSQSLFAIRTATEILQLYIDFGKKASVVAVSCNTATVMSRNDQTRIENRTILLNYCTLI